jgi:c-di-GMP-related signal transduction protein
MDSANEQVFVARQPIYDRKRRVFGYELLFRAPQGARGSVSIDEESAALISESILAFGLDTLTHGRPTFVKVSRHVLFAGLPHALPAQQMVIQLPDDSTADAATMDACVRLRHQGYRIALDMSAPRDDIAPLLSQVDYLKADVNALGALALLPIGGPTRMATRVESAQDFEASAFTCSLFQGDFIGRPVMRATTDIPGHRLTYLRLFRALQNPDISPRELEDLIKPDASLVYRLLRAVNSAAFAQHSRVESIRQALVLLGYGTVRQWASLWAMSSFNAGAPDELVTISTVRGRTCEIVANEDAAGSFGDGFLLGMSSLLDAILEIPIEDVLSHLPLPAEADAALRGEDNKSRRLLDCVIAFEHGRWEDCYALAKQAGIDPDVVPVAYRQALKWYGQFRAANDAA